MDYKLIIVLVLVVVIIGSLYYSTFIAKPIRNQGELTVEVGGASQMPRFKPNDEQIEDPLHNIGSFDPEYPQPPTRGAQMNPIKQNTNVLPYPQISNNYAPQQANVSGKFATDSGQQPKLDCFPKDVITPQELMPREDSYNTWQQTSPPVSGHLADRNYLESGHHFGIDTVSNSLRNANLQLRSDPLIPQIQVGPWMQSTIGADTNHRQLEIGGDY
jgi:hypothetical protein